MQPSLEYTSLIKSARKYTQLTPSKWKFSPNKLFAKLCKEISIPSNKYSSTLGNHQKDLRFQKKSYVPRITKNQKKNSKVYESFTITKPEKKGEEVGQKKSYEELRDNDIDIGNVSGNISDYEPSNKFDDSDNSEAAEELPDGDLDRSIYRPEEMLEFPEEMERTLNDLIKEENQYFLRLQWEM